jgi:lipopolysaccharide export system permease protein
MFGGILFRMILWDLFKVFTLALVTITGILLLAGIIAEATQQGLGPKQILSAIPLLIPSTLPYTIPATTLFAACLVYGRMSADHEIVAIKAAGGNLIGVLAPGIILGLSMSLVTASMYYRIIPYTHHLLRAMVFQDLEELLYSTLKRSGSLSHPQMQYSMYVKGVQGKKLISPVFKRKNARGVVDVVARAREATLEVDIENRQIILHMKFGEATSEDGNHAQFDKKEFAVPLPPGLEKYDNPRPRDMTWHEMVERQRELDEQLEHAVAETAKAEANSGEEAHTDNLRAREKPIRAHKQHIYVEMLMRPALSIGCLCFVLVACPVAVWFSRGDFLGSFITCFMPIVIAYYPLVLCGTNMAKEARFNEWVLVFGPNVVVALVGLALLRWLVRY